VEYLGRSVSPPEGAVVPGWPVPPFQGASPVSAGERRVTGTPAQAGRAQAQQAASVEPFTLAVVADPHCAEAPKAGIESYGNGIVFAHIPPERTGADRNMYLSRNDSWWFNALVQKTGPEAMFFGHLHQATEEYRIGATQCFNVRSCCWNFNRGPLGFLLVSVDGDGLAVREIETGAYA